MYLKGAMVAVHDVVGVAPPPQGLTRESVSIAQQHVQQEQPGPRITCIIKPLGFLTDQTWGGALPGASTHLSKLCDGGPGFLRACKACKELRDLALAAADRGSSTCC